MERTVKTGRLSQLAFFVEKDGQPRVMVEIETDLAPFVVKLTREEVKDALTDAGVTPEQMTDVFEAFKSSAAQKMKFKTKG